MIVCSKQRNTFSPRVVSHDHVEAAKFSARFPRISLCPPCVLCQEARAAGDSDVNSRLVIQLQQILERMICLLMIFRSFMQFEQSLVSR